MGPFTWSPPGLCSGGKGAHRHDVPVLPALSTPATPPKSPAPPPGLSARDTRSAPSSARNPGPKGTAPLLATSPTCSMWARRVPMSTGCQVEGRKNSQGPHGTAGFLLREAPSPDQPPRAGRLNTRVLPMRGQGYAHSSGRRYLEECRVRAPRPAPRGRRASQKGRPVRPIGR